ncbi:MAG: SH3 domain-containing protein [Clostridia bacterium]|nr:SH3 domain-containing protein [Clostridia bacterium]
MKRYWAMLLFILLTLCGLTAGALGQTLYVVNPHHEDRLNLRASATPGSEILSRLYTGTAVDVLQVLTDYTFVRLGANEGYLANEFLAEERTDWLPGSWRVVNLPKDGETLNLRKEANSGATVLDRIGNGTTVYCLDDSGAYTKVQTIDTDAYLLAENLAKDGDGAKPIATKLTVGKTETDVELRCFPSPDAMSLGAVAQGTSVRILDIAGTWYYVEASGRSFPGNGSVPQRGFISNRDLRVGNHVDGVAPTGNVYAVVKTEKDGIRLPMRSSPGMGGAVIATLVNTAQVQLHTGLPGPNDTWWFIRVGVEEGYIVGQYMQLIESEPPDAWR